MNFIVIIYNRWGEKIYTSTDPDFCWDGKYNDKVMDPQVLVYYIESKYTNAKTLVKKGNVSLIR